MRSRQHVVIARLSDEEYEVYQWVLRRGERTHRYPRNRSEQFRLALRVIHEMLNQEAAMTFYERCLDV